MRCRLTSGSAVRSSTPSLHGIAAALPVFRAQNSGHFVDVVSVAGLSVRPGMAVHGATKNAVRAISEGLRQAAVRRRASRWSRPASSTPASPTRSPIQGTGRTDRHQERIAIAPEAIAEAIAYAVGQPSNVDVNDIVVRAPLRNEPAVAGNGVRARGPAARIVR